MVARPQTKFDPKKVGKAPEGYIPGISRGDCGFVTRTDIGPLMPDMQMGLSRARMQAQQNQRNRNRRPEVRQDARFNDSRFDNWSGIDEASLFKGAQYDDEDKEADNIYKKVDE